MIQWSAKLETVLLASVMGLTACAGMQQYSYTWPHDLPTRRHFEQLYQADEHNRSLQTEQQYLTWVIRFYKQWEVIPQGWKDIEADVLDGIEDKRYPVILAKLRRLGKLISGDWAKDNSVRHITTAMLSLWGEVIYIAIELDKREVTIDLILTDVLDLLSGALTQEMIEPGRYEAKLEISLNRML